MGYSDGNLQAFRMRRLIRHVTSWVARSAAGTLDRSEIRVVGFATGMLDRSEIQVVGFVATGALNCEANIRGFTFCRVHARPQWNSHGFAS